MPASRLFPFQHALLAPGRSDHGWNSTTAGHFLAALARFMLLLFGQKMKVNKRRVSRLPMLER